MSEKQENEKTADEVAAEDSRDAGNSGAVAAPATAVPEPETTTESDAETDVEAEAKKSVGKGTLVVVILIFGSLLWYLFSDRHTPYTSQARVEGYVIGVAPKVAGLVTDVWVNNNEEVRAGQKLFQIDSSAYQIALNKAESDLQTVYRQVEAGNAGVAAARANLLAARANEDKAEKDLNRLQRLYEQDPGTISVRRLEISQATLDQAKAGVMAAGADIRRAIEIMGGADIEKNAQLKSALSAVDRASLDMANTTVVASSDGIITDLQAEVGQYAGTGAPVLTLISVRDVWINAEFTENNLGNMKPGDRAEILFDVLPGEVFEGTVRSIGFGVSGGAEAVPGTLPSLSNNRDWLRQSQRFPVAIQFDPEQEAELRGQLRIGGQAAIVVYTADKGLLNFLARIHIRVMSWMSYAY